ncbi:MAG: MFS transporter, partial [Firmicutes bacterium]|nr:MFS transporter [Bacillota bacterium]
GFIIFYMTGLGLSAGVVGTVVMVSRFADAVTDVFVGNRVDQTHTRFGKARPWILGGALPVT